LRYYDIKQGHYDNLDSLIKFSAIYPLISLPLMFLLLPSQAKMNKQFEQFNLKRQQQAA